ncbi:hypothetical protein [Siphonobacter sp. BAB-5405]|uniref:hypothetical protein n=1 Tax=Siphonobacter sp. BAB-5405 TaxID=1864825 RepID=UPI0013049470|nr:hypothetical protein [Siphonobacter sp. BAB-5405]
MSNPAFSIDLIMSNDKMGYEYFLFYFAFDDVLYPKMGQFAPSANYPKAEV